MIRQLLTRLLQTHDQACALLATLEDQARVVRLEGDKVIERRPEGDWLITYMSDYVKYYLDPSDNYFHVSYTSDCLVATLAAALDALFAFQIAAKQRGKDA